MKCFGCKVPTGWYNVPIGVIVFAESEEEFKPLVLKALVEYLASSSAEFGGKPEKYAQALCEGDTFEIFEVEMKPNTVYLLGAEDYYQHLW